MRHKAYKCFNSHTGLKQFIYKFNEGDDQVCQISIHNNNRLIQLIAERASTDVGNIYHFLHVFIRSSVRDGLTKCNETLH